MIQASRRITRSRFLTLALTFMAAMSLSSCGTPGAAGEEKGMITQVGLVWLKHPGNADERQKIISAVHAFAREIPEVHSAVVGETDGIAGPFSDTSYDAGFILTFKDEASRQRYNTHPVHQRAAREVFLPFSRKLLFYRFVTK